MEQKFLHFRDGFPSFAGMFRLVFKAVHRHRACLVKAGHLCLQRGEQAGSLLDISGWKPKLLCSALLE
jgi:hypothetical protein